MKRLLLKIIVQPIWVEIDDDDNATELVSKPTAINPKDAQSYLDQVFELADKFKRGEIEQTQA